MIVTDCLVRLHPLDRGPAEAAMWLLTLGRRNAGATPWRRNELDEAFTPRELKARIVEPSGLRLMQPLDLALSAKSWDNLIRFADGELFPRTGKFYPHILVQTSRSVFTSVCLVLERPTAAR